MSEIHDSKLSLDQYNQISPQFQDSFKPQKILVDFSITPLKQNTESVRSINIQSSEIQQFQQSVQQPRTSVHIKKLHRNSERFLIKKDKIQSNTSIMQKQNPKIFKMFYKETLIKKFLDKLRKQAYILPQVIPIKMKNFLTENFIDEKRMFEKQFQNSSSKKNKFPILNPTGFFMNIWNILQTLQLIFLMWWFPFKISFQPTYTLQNCETILVYMFLCDIILKLNQGFIKEGEFIMNRVDIIKHYFSNELTEDVIYFVSQLFLIIDFDIDLRYFFELLVVIQFIMNFIKLKTKIKKFEETFATHSSYTQFVDLIQLIITVFYFAHFMACTWYYVGRVSLTKNEISWTTKINLINKDPTSFYLYSFYWAITTMVTVGYGDISAQNNEEVLCATLMMIFSTGMFAFAINQIGEIFTNIDAEKQNFKRSILLINQYMKQNDVDQQIQSRVRNYLKFQEKIKKQTQNDELKQIFQKLPNNLYEDLQKHIQSKIIEEVQFYKYYFSKSVIENVSSSLQILSFTPKEIIFTQGQLDDCSLFTVWKGEVLIIDNQTNKILATLQKGQCFGEAEFLSFSQRQFSAVSKDLSQVLKMPRELFLKIIRNSQKDFEQFHKLKDSFLFEKKNYISQCYCCSENHFITDCQVCYYKPNVESMLKRQQVHECIDYRKQHPRKSFKKTFCQYQSYKSEVSEDKQEMQIQPRASSSSDREVSVVTRTPTRHRTNNIQVLNHKTFGHAQDDKNQEDKYQSLVDLQFEKASIVKILELPSLKNKQPRPSNNNIVISSMNQLDQIQQEFYKDFMTDFDTIKQYDNYFPQNNIDVVLMKLVKSYRNKRMLITETGGEYTRRKLQTEVRQD